MSPRTALCRSPSFSERGQGTTPAPRPRGNDCVVVGKPTRAGKGPPEVGNNQPEQRRHTMEGACAVGRVTEKSPPGEGLEGSFLQKGTERRTKDEMI